jgi:hypothetical protein
MKYKPVSVIARDNGMPYQADLCVCGVCEGQIFCCYQIEGQEGFHLQCLQCTTTYCLGHVCTAPDGA